jgi:hypothetical protein
MKGEIDLPPVRGKVGVNLTGFVILEGSHFLAASSRLARDFAIRSWAGRVDVGVGSAVGPDISQ